jgi:tRNA modification GTPase
MIEQVAENKRLIVFNKSDIRRASNDALDEENAIFVSALTGDGLSELRKRIACELDVEPLRDAPQITNVRHVALLDDANEALARAEAAIASRHGAISEEFVLADLRAARGALEEISGKRVTDDLLAHIFSSFCIGK